MRETKKAQATVLGTLQSLQMTKVPTLDGRSKPDVFRTRCEVYEAVSVDGIRCHLMVIGLPGDAEWGRVHSAIARDELLKSWALRYATEADSKREAVLSGIRGAGAKPESSATITLPVSRFRCRLFRFPGIEVHEKLTTVWDTDQDPTTDIPLNAFLLKEFESVSEHALHGRLNAYLKTSGLLATCWNAGGTSA